MTAARCQELLAQIRAMGYDAIVKSRRDRVENGKCTEDDRAGLERTLKTVTRAQKWYDEFVRQRGRQPTASNMNAPGMPTETRQHLSSMYPDLKPPRGTPRGTPKGTPKPPTPRTGPANNGAGPSRPTAAKRATFRGLNALVVNWSRRGQEWNSANNGGPSEARNKANGKRPVTSNSSNSRSNGLGGGLGRGKGLMGFGPLGPSVFPSDSNAAKAPRPKRRVVTIDCGTEVVVRCRP